jgi:hypothetical protein
MITPVVAVYQRRVGADRANDESQNENPARRPAYRVDSRRSRRAFGGNGLCLRHDMRYPSMTVHWGDPLIGNFDNGSAQSFSITKLHHSPWRDAVFGSICATFWRPAPGTGRRGWTVPARPVKCLPQTPGGKGSITGHRWSGESAGDPGHPAGDDAARVPPRGFRRAGSAARATPHRHAAPPRRTATPHRHAARATPHRHAARVPSRGPRPGAAERGTARTPRRPHPWAGAAGERARGKPRRPRSGPQAVAPLPSVLPPCEYTLRNSFGLKVDAVKLR